MAVPAFQMEKLSNRITRIFAPSRELMYLVEGDDRAALLDSGCGIGFVRPLIKRLTDKPLVVLLTHGHIDHAMGASEFPPENVYINKEDAYVYQENASHAFRKGGLCLMGPAGQAVVPEEDFTPERPITAYRDLKEGDRFDLGGISVEVYACPGHTRGTLVMLIPQARALLLGDACNSRTFLFGEESTSVEEYQESLIKLEKALAGKYDVVLSSHGDGWLAPGIMGENIALCQRILDGTADQEPFEFQGSHGLIADAIAEPRHGNIVYHPEHIRR